MFCIKAIASILLVLILVSCSSAPPSWRSLASLKIEQARREGADKFKLPEFLNLLETFEHGDAIMHVNGDDGEADEYYLLTIQKGTVLHKSVQEHKRKLAEEARLKEIEEEAVRAEEKRMKELLEQERREELKTTNLPYLSQSNQDHARIKTVQPTYHTVRRGETLPQIAARYDIYNDSALWPLIYRSNRDQVRDPKQLWPGQVLRIPRNFSRDDAVEARKQAVKK